MTSGHASQAAVVGVTLAFTVVAVIAVVLRLYVRFLISRNAGIEDGFISAAAAMSIGLAICTCLETYYGVGRHQWTISPSEGTALLKTLYASIILYNTGLSTTKLSILLQYLRVFPQHGFLIVCYVAIGIVSVFLCWTFWSTVFLCRPAAAFWNMHITDATCLNRQAVWFVNAGFNIFTDIAITVLPLPMLKQLHIAKRPKIGLMLVFGLGGFTCIMSILRLESIYAFTTHPQDQSWNNALAAMWSVIELNTGILCSCLPTLKALVTRVFPRLFKSSYAGRSHPTPEFGAAFYGTGKRSRITNEELGRGLDGRGDPMQQAYISRASRHSIGMEDLGSSPKDIRVVTVVNQEVERSPDEGARSDQESTRDLIHKTSFSD